MKVLAGEIEPSAGNITVSSDQRISVLKQDHFRYQEETVLQTVLMGHEKLYLITKEKDAIYSKPDFSEADGNRAAELEGEFASLGGWTSETDAATLLSGLGITEKYLNKKIKELKDAEKIRVLLAQALFGRPDNLLLDEPTNHLDDRSIRWLEEYLLKL